MNIYETKSVVESIEAMNAMCEKIQQDIVDVRTPLTTHRMQKLKRFFIKLMASSCLIICVILTICFVFTGFAGNRVGPIEGFLSCVFGALFVGAAPIAIIEALVYIVLEKSVAKKEENRALTMQEQSVVEEYCRQIKEIEVQITQKRECLLASEVPARYHHSVMLNLMIGFIENKRADTLKEAINLLEQFAEEERRHRELVESQGDTYYIVK